jgi:hypothetical protein
MVRVATVETNFPPIPFWIGGVPDGYFETLDGKRRLRSPVLFFAPTE